MIQNSRTKVNYILTQTHATSTIVPKDMHVRVRCRRVAQKGKQVRILRCTAAVWTQIRPSAPLGNWEGRSGASFAAFESEYLPNGLQAATSIASRITCRVVTRCRVYANGGMFDALDCSHMRTAITAPCRNPLHSPSCRKRFQMPKRCFAVYWGFSGESQHAHACSNASFEDAFSRRVAT